MAQAELADNLISTLQALMPGDEDQAVRVAKTLAETKASLLLNNYELIALLLEKSNGQASMWVAHGLNISGQGLLEGRKEFALKKEPVPEPKPLPAEAPAARISATSMQTAAAEKRPSALEMLMKHPNMNHALFCEGLVGKHDNQAAVRGMQTLTRSNGAFAKSLFKLLDSNGIKTVVTAMANDTRDGGRPFIEAMIKSHVFRTPFITTMFEGSERQEPNKNFPLAFPAPGTGCTVHDNIDEFIAAAMTNPIITSQFISNPGVLKMVKTAEEHKTDAAKHRAEEDAERQKHGQKVPVAKVNGANGKKPGFFSFEYWFGAKPEKSVLKPVITAPVPTAAATPLPAAPEPEKPAESPYANPELLMYRLKELTPHSVSIIVDGLLRHNCIDALKDYMAGMSNEQVCDIFVNRRRGALTAAECTKLAATLDSNQAVVAGNILLQCAPDRLQENHGELASLLITKNIGLSDYLSGFVSKPSDRILDLHTALSVAVHEMSGSRKI